jgi:hypothetical protein
MTFTAGTQSERQFLSTAETQSTQSVECFFIETFSLCVLRASAVKKVFFA